MRPCCSSTARANLSIPINRELAAKIGMDPFAMAPLVLRGKSVGVIGIDRSFENGSITEEKFKILQMFANQAAITIHSLVSKERAAP